MTFSTQHIRFWENVPACPIRLKSRNLDLIHNFECRTQLYSIRFTLLVPDRGRLPIMASIDPRHMHHIEGRKQWIVWDGRLCVDCSLAYHLYVPYFQFQAVFDDEKRECRVTMSENPENLGFLDRAFEHLETCGLCRQKLECLDLETSSYGA